MDKILQLLKQLNLHGMLEHLDKINLSIQEQNLSWLQALELLLIQEYEYKKCRTLRYRLKIAKLPSIKLLSDTKQAHLVADINLTTLINNHQNLLFIGGCGSGKTHLASSLAYNAITNNYRVRFYTANDLARSLLNAQYHNYETRFYDNLQRFHLLIIDELGYIPIDKNAIVLFLELLGKLHERVSIIVTTQLRFDEWAGNIFANHKSTKTLIDRLTHNCKVIETGNQSFRLKGDALTQ